MGFCSMVNCVYDSELDKDILKLAAVGQEDVLIDVEEGPLGAVPVPVQAVVDDEELVVVLSVICGLRVHVLQRGAAGAHLGFQRGAHGGADPAGVVEDEVRTEDLEVFRWRRGGRHGGGRVTVRGGAWPRGAGGGGGAAARAEVLVYSVVLHMRYCVLCVVITLTNHKFYCSATAFFPVLSIISNDTSK
jgi:hypothetical protein